jgi:hypothetical protein
MASSSKSLRCLTRTPTTSKQMQVEFERQEGEPAAMTEVQPASASLRH